MIDDPTQRSAGTRRTAVLFLLNSLNAGGAERHTVDLANRLERASFRVGMAYIRPDQALLPEVRLEPDERLQNCGTRRKFSIGCIRQLARSIKDGAYDVIVAVNQFSLMYALAARRLSGTRVPVLTVFHTTLLKSRKEERMMRLYRWFFRMASVVVFVSSRQADYWLTVKRLPVKRPHVIHNGIRVREFRELDAQRVAAVRESYGIGAGDYTLGICAGLRPEKRHEDLLQAVHDVGDRLPSLRLLIIGDGPRREFIERRIAELGLQGRVFLTGYQQDVRPFVAACDSMVIASGAVETFSLAILEAMALEKPVLCTRIGGAEEQIEHGVNGMAFEIGDIAALGRYIVELADEALRKRMGAAGLDKVSRLFQHDAMVSKYEALLRYAVGMQSGSASAAPGTEYRPEGVA